MSKINKADLIARAIAAAKNAHCPYSKLKVGAALLAADGSIFTGCNMENASYGLTICAERAAFSAAISAGKRSFKAIAIVAGSRSMPYPCGACRQVMAEFCDTSFKIFCSTILNPAKAEELHLGAILPKSFKL